jgi:hypothetical protein
MESQLAAFLFVAGTLYQVRIKITAVIAARINAALCTFNNTCSAVWEMFPSLVIM